MSSARRLRRHAREINCLRSSSSDGVSGWNSSTKEFLKFSKVFIKDDKKIKEN